MPDILFAESSSHEIEAAVMADYERISGRTLYPGDPVRLFLEALAYTISVQNAVINLAGRQNLLAYAQGEHLDYIGMMVGTARLGASRATCRQSFTLAQPLDFKASIPAGTRVATSDGRAMFRLLENLEIEPGGIEAIGAAEAEEPGAKANGLLPGQINLMVDPVPYVARTANTTPSMLGSDVESDDRYRERIRLAPESFTCAGPVESYRCQALAAHQDISDCAVYSPEPGVVEARPVLKGGELPTEEVLDAVRARLSAEDVRPLTDTVIVAAPELAEYEIDFTWHLDKANEALLGTITAKVAAAVEEYRLWQREKPGRDILPLKLEALLERAGARRLELRAPQFRALEPWQLARESRAFFEYGGAEE